MSHSHLNNNNSHDTRLHVISDWLQIVLPHDHISINSLAGDASSRRYHRVHLTDDQVYILMDSIADLPSLHKFISVAELMADHVNVPDLIAKDTDNGLLLLQDFGTVEFAHLLLDADDEQINDYYQQAMAVIHDIQKIDNEQGRQAQLPDYDTALLMREVGLFTEWFLPYINVELAGHDTELWQAFTTELISHILHQPQVVVHRDFHSRNLMQDTHTDQALGVIDFQDAVIGAYSYDIVSLVRDAYVTWDEATVEQWLRDFHHGLTIDCSFEQFYHDVAIMGIQRQLKVLGIFVRLSQRDGKDRYLDDIPKVMNDMLFELTWLKNSAQGDMQKLADQFLTLLETDILPRYTNKFAL